MTTADATLISHLSDKVDRMQQAILSATGVLRESNDPKAREAANVLYRGVKGGGKTNGPR